MRSDDTLTLGLHGIWYWIVSREPIADLMELTIQHHLDRRLWITTFDSGTIRPNADDLVAGWKLVGGVMVSPPLAPRLPIPCDQYDEWLLFNDDSARQLSWEPFVNFGGFTLADPRQMAQSFDPTWERDALDWLGPVQERFWSQLDRLLPISYVGCGDNDIVVSRCQPFVESVRQAAKRGDELSDNARFT
jgi:hypothetical protein